MKRRTQLLFTLLVFSLPLAAVTEDARTSR